MQLTTKVKKPKRNIWDPNFKPYGTYTGEPGNPEQWSKAYESMLFTREQATSILTGVLETPYEILGVSRNECPEKIRLAWVALVVANHPDKGGDRAKFERIMAAYSLIR